MKRKNQMDFENMRSPSVKDKKIEKVQEQKFDMVNRRLVQDLTVAVEQLEQSLDKFKQRKMMDKSKAKTGHYSLKSKIKANQLDQSLEDPEEIKL